MLAFLASPIAKYLIAGLLAAAVLAGDFMWGYHNGANSVKVAVQKTEIAAQAKTIQKAAEVAAATAVQASAAAAIGASVVHETEIIHEKAKQLIVKVPVYVPASAVAGCAVPSGFVGLWNDANAAAGVGVPAAAGGGQQPDAAGGGAGDVQAEK